MPYGAWDHSTTYTAIRCVQLNHSNLVLSASRGSDRNLDLNRGTHARDLIEWHSSSGLMLLNSGE